MIARCLAALFPFATIAASFLCFEYIAKYPGLRYVSCGLNILYTAFAVQHPPTPSPFINYISGVLPVVYTLRSLEILVITDPLSMKRLRKVGLSSYRWEPLPPPLCFRRLLWAIELLANPRAIGWSHGPTRYLPITIDTHGESRVCCATKVREPNRRSFLWRQVYRLAISYVWFDFYLATFDHGNGPGAEMRFDGTAFRFLDVHLTPAIRQTLNSWVARVSWLTSLRFFFDSCHAIVSLVAVGLFTETWLGTAGEPWAYPALFGGSLISKPSIKDFWTKWWHNLLFHPFKSVAVWLCPPARYKALYVFAAFSFSGIAHGVGEYTASRRILPAARVLVGFCLQPVAILYQQKISQWLRLHDFGVPMAQPLIIWATEAISSLTWAFYIFPWLFDDPNKNVPFSFLRLPFRVLSTWSLSLFFSPPGTAAKLE